MTVMLEGAYPSNIICGLFGGQHNNLSDYRMDGMNGCHKLLLFKKGTGRVMLNGVTHGFGPNSLIIAPADCPHKIDIGKSGLAIVIAVPKRVQIGIEISPSLQTLTQGDDIANITQLFEAAVEEHAQGDDLGLLAVVSYINLINVFARRLEVMTDESESPSSHRLMQRFSTLVEDQYFTGKNINSYAAELGVTATHLTRVCQKMNGMSASQFLQQRILAESQHLLFSTDQRISEVSRSLGFSNAAYFSRFFNERVGVSPKAYRENYRS